MRFRTIMMTAAVAALLSPVAAAGPFPPADQKRPPLVLKSHGIFWAGGKIVNHAGG
jgi:uncharacterized membrane protein